MYWCLIENSDSYQKRDIQECSAAETTHGTSHTNCIFSDLQMTSHTIIWLDDQPLKTN